MKQRFIGWVRAYLHWLSPDDARLSTLVSGLRAQLAQAQGERDAHYQAGVSLSRERDDLRQVLVFVKGECDALKSRVVQTDGPVFDRIRVLVTEQDQIAGRSGEAKRHQVLARARKEFPDLATLTLSKLIDAAVEVSH